MRNLILLASLTLSAFTASGAAWRLPFFDLFEQNSQRLAFTLKKPAFTGDIQHYQLLYHGSSWHPSIAVAGYLHPLTAVAVGLGFSIDWYQDEGVAAQVAADGTLSRAEAEQTQLTLVPLRVLGVASLKPLGAWVSFDLAAGLEYLYGQEIRVASGDPEGEVRLAPLLNRSWHPYRVLCGGINLSLHALEAKAMRALQRGLGISNVYLSLQLEMVQKLTEVEVDFSRRALALGIVFEAG